MLIQPSREILKELGIDMELETFECFNCGSEFEDTPEDNAYHGFKVDRENMICQKCLDYMLDASMNPPQFMMSPRGPVRITNDLVLPFSKNNWILLKCK